jgi:NaMN:DMB phosphoribosyltransferase
MEGIDVTRCAGDPVVVRVAGLPLCSACARREAETQVDG